MNMLSYKWTWFHIIILLIVMSMCHVVEGNSMVHRAQNYGSEEPSMILNGNGTNDDSGMTFLNNSFSTIAPAQPTIVPLAGLFESEMISTFSKGQVRNEEPILSRHHRAKRELRYPTNTHFFDRRHVDSNYNVPQPRQGIYTRNRPSFGVQNYGPLPNDYPRSSPQLMVGRRDRNTTLYRLVNGFQLKIEHFPRPQPPATSAVIIIDKSIRLYEGVNRSGEKYRKEYEPKEVTTEHYDDNGPTTPVLAQIPKEVEEEWLDADEKEEPTNGIRTDKLNKDKDVEGSGLTEDENEYDEDDENDLDEGEESGSAYDDEDLFIDREEDHFWMGRPSKRPSINGPPLYERKRMRRHRRPRKARRPIKPTFF